jgi:transcriptional regulator with XRE-family HTH domain
MHFAVVANTANSLEQALELFKSQVLARESCEAQCDAWNAWFADMMRDHRRESGARGSDTADRMGISRSYLAMLESGARRWSEPLIRKYFEAVGVGRG